jgi:biotin synthase
MPPPLSTLAQALCFLAGANSIFDGDKLLTTPNNDRGEDEAMFEALGLVSRPAFTGYSAGNDSSRDFGEQAPAPAADGGCGGRKHAHA